MDWNDYWRVTEAINQTGQPKYTVWVDAQTPEDEFMKLWVEKWYKRCFYLEADGCGCCYSDYRIDAPQEAIDELYDFEIDIREFDDSEPEPIITGTPSSFLSFSKNAHRKDVDLTQNNG